MSIFKSNDIISATKRNDIKLLKKIIKNSNLDYKDKNHKTAIFYAVENDNIEVLDLLITNGANVYIKDDRELTIFHYVLLYKNARLTKYFLSNDKYDFNINKIENEISGVKIKDNRIFLSIIKKLF